MLRNDVHRDVEACWRHEKSLFSAVDSRMVKSNYAKKEDNATKSAKVRILQAALDSELGGHTHGYQRDTSEFQMDWVVHREPMQSSARHLALSRL